MQRWILFVLLIVATLPAAAQPTPITRVWRADTRPPSDVLQNGFMATGTSLDVMAHASGSACHQGSGPRATAWVSTTSDFQRADGFARWHLSAANAYPVVWIYTIRPDASYLSVERLMRQAIGEGLGGRSPVYTPDHARTLHALLGRTSVGLQREVVTHYVAPENIVESVSVRFIDGRYVLGTPVRNPRYVEANTTVGLPVTDLAALVPPASIRMEDDGLSSCAMACDGAAARNVSSRTLASTSVSDAQCAAYGRSLPSPAEVFLLLGD